jgi:putative transposase
LNSQAKGEAGAATQEKTKISERRAYLLAGLSLTVLHYKGKAQPENEQLQNRMVELAGEHRRFGYRRLHALLRREGVEANHKRVFRLYQEAGLAVKRRRKRHGVAVEREQLALQAGPMKYGQWISSAIRWPMAGGSRC